MIDSHSGLLPSLPLIVGAAHTVLGAPLVTLLGVFVLLGAWRRGLDERIGRVLEAVLARESREFPGRVGADPLDFRTSDRVGMGGLWAAGVMFPWRVKVVRTVVGTVKGGYRVRLWAIACGLQGRLVERSTEVTVLRSG